MNHDEIQNKITAKREELRRLEADEARLNSALKAAEGEHVEALIALELEEAGAANRVRKAQGDLEKATKALSDASTRRKTLAVVLGRMAQDARSSRTAELFAQREQVAKRVIEQEPRVAAALDAYLAHLRGVAQELAAISDIERELDGLIAEPQRLNRINLQLPLGSHIDLSQASKYAAEVADQNRRRLEAVRLDPTLGATVQQGQPALEPVGA